MPPDQHPIPPEALPPGWGVAAFRDDYLSYRHCTIPLELVADRTVSDRSHPGLGLGRCWELRHRYSLDDRSIANTIGRVSTRKAAVEGLMACMDRIHAAVDEPADPIEIRDVLDRVSLEDVVPDALGTR